MDRYSLSRGRRRVVRIIALLFFALGAVDIVEAALPLIAPSYVQPVWTTDRGFVGQPEDLLPEPARFRLATNAAAKKDFHARLEQPDIRIGHFLLTLAADASGIFVLCGMGTALWQSTRTVPDAVESGLPWLMAVGWACVAVATIFPIFDGLRTVLLLNGIMPTPPVLWYDPDTSGTTYVLLLIAAGILAATWTISAGLKARADMAEIV